MQQNLTSEKAKDVADTSDFAKNNDLAGGTSDVQKLDIDKLVKVPSCFNSLKRKVGNLDINKLKAVPIYLKNSSDVGDEDVLKASKYIKNFKY